MLALLLMTLTSSPLADRAELLLVDRLADARVVFFGRAAPSKSGPVNFTVTEPLKGPVKSGATVRHLLAAGDEYGRPAARPTGELLVFIDREERATAFPAQSFEGRCARPTLALLASESASLEPFRPGLSKLEEATRLIREVFGHQRMPRQHRIAAVREVLSGAKPDWDVPLSPLPEALRLPELVEPFTAYFTRFPREQFRSAMRWVLFSELASKAAVPYLLEELAAVRLAEDLNVAHYVFDALEASDRPTAACVFARIMESEGGLWLSRNDLNREAAEALTERLARLGAPRPDCPAPQVPKDARSRYPKASTGERLRTLRALAYWAPGSPELTRWLLDRALAEKDEELGAHAIRAAGRVAERTDFANAAELDANFEALRSWFTRHRNPSADAATAAAGRRLRALQLGAAAGPGSLPLEQAAGMLGEGDPEVRKEAARLVVQLAVKGNYSQYRSQTPELAALVPALFSRVEASKGIHRQRLIEALAGFPDDGLSPDQRRKRSELGGGGR